MRYEGEIAEGDVFRCNDGTRSRVTRIQDRGVEPYRLIHFLEDDGPPCMLSEPSFRVLHPAGKVETSAPAPVTAAIAGVEPIALNWTAVERAARDAFGEDVTRAGIARAIVAALREVDRQTSGLE